MSREFTVGLSHDFVSAGGATSWGDIGLDELTAAGVRWEFLSPDTGELDPGAVDGYDAVLFSAPAVTARSVSGFQPPLLLARFGVGLDEVDLDACSRAGVAVTITPDGARRAVATAALALILAVSHNLTGKDRLARTGGWNERLNLLGRGITGRKVGVFGLGNIAAELFTLLAPFGTINLATDPLKSPQDAAALNVGLVPLPELMRTCDIVVITAALTEQTRGAINAEMLALLARDAVLVNVSRGPIVDTDALAEALRTGRLRAAGLDVTEPEPLEHDHPLLSLPNVTLTAHSLAWTDEMAIGNGRSAIRAILDVRAGRAPTYLANPGVLMHERLRRFITTEAVS